MDPLTRAALGVAQDLACEIRLRLGQEEIALVQFAAPGRPYPAPRRSDDLWFQHLAIVVRDMDEAYAALETHAAEIGAETGAAGTAGPGAAGAWQPISRGGPQTLPAQNGGVQAFKFRDPDGHPLELLWFPPGSGRACWHARALASGGTAPFLGIDHTALAVRSTARSLDFYRGLGLEPGEHTWNTGPAQSRLDGLEAAQVEVTPLRPASEESPGIELLAYSHAGPGPAPGQPSVAVTDLASDWIVAAARPEGGSPPARALIDPDGHRLLLIAASEDGRLLDQ